MRLCLGKLNFIIMGIAALMILIGFAMTAGPASTPEHFEPDVFSNTRIIYGPNICFFGYLLMIVGICVKGKKNNNYVEPVASETVEAAETVETAD